MAFNALPWIERCLESVGGHETIVVDNGSSDGTQAFVRERFPDVRLIEQENRGMGGGNNAGMRVASGRYFLLLNSDAWVVGDAIGRLVQFADEHPDAAVVGPRLRYPDGRLQRSVRAFPTLWRLATEYLFLRKLGPRTQSLNSFYGGGFAHDETREVDWLFGPCLLVRRDAADEVGLFDEDFFMFSEETDWSYRFHQAGWKVYFHPEAEVVHVGGASHGDRLYRENVRSHLRYFAKHHGSASAERARKVMLAGARIRARIYRGERRERYADAARWLAASSVRELLDEPR